MLRSDRFILLGPSGCGKSTLLKAVGGYMAPTEGEIRLNGEKVHKPGPDRMMVFQEFDQLLPWKTVRENVMFPLRFKNVDDSDPPSMPEAERTSAPTSAKAFCKPVAL